jgi:hypothetical protein
MEHMPEYKKLLSILGKYHTISLGYNCYIKRFLDKHGKRGETNLFDWLGTSMWAINELFKQDFQGAFDPDKYVDMHITPGRWIPTHSDYYIRALHDKPQDLQEKCLRRWERMHQLLNTTKAKVMFIRLEEDVEGRIRHHKYRQYNRYDELHYIGEFIEVIKNKYPTLNFTILFISWRCDSCYFKHRGIEVIIVKFGGIRTLKWENCALQLQKVISYGYNPEN